MIQLSPWPNCFQHLPRDNFWQHRIKNNFGLPTAHTNANGVNSRCHCVQREGNVFSLVVASRLVELHSPVMTTKVCSHIPLSHKGFGHALAHKATTSSAPVCPNTKLSGRNNWPNGPARTLSIVPAVHVPTHC